MRATIGLGVLLLVSACGGNVTVEAGQGSGGATTSASTTSGAGGAITTTASTISTSTSPIADCTTFGLVGAGLPCNQEGATCRMDYACCQGTIACKGGAWSADPPACAQACRPCGDGLSCSIDAICVHDTAVYDSYQCVQNPCPGAPDCSCAAMACAMNYQQCQATEMYTVTCGQ